MRCEALEPTDLAYVQQSVYFRLTYPSWPGEVNKAKKLAHNSASECMKGDDRPRMALINQAHWLRDLRASDGVLGMEKPPTS